MAPFERAMVVSYGLSSVTVALSAAIWVECLRRSNQQGWATLGQNFRVSPWSIRPLIFGSAESEHPKLTNDEIISEEFQPM